MGKLANQSSKGRFSFWKTLPGVLTALTSFIAAVVGLLVAIQQINNNKSNTSTPPPRSGYPGPLPNAGQPANNATSCQVSGNVYDRDNNLPLNRIQVGYVTASKPDHLVYERTTGLDGKFNFTCQQTNPADFPLHLQMTYTWDVRTQIFQCDDPIDPGNNSVDIYLSLRDVTNRHQFKMPLMHANSSNMLHKKFILPTNKASVLPLPAQAK